MVLSRLLSRWRKSLLKKRTKVDSQTEKALEWLESFTDSEDLCEGLDASAEEQRFLKNLGAAYYLKESSIHIRGLWECAVVLARHFGKELIEDIDESEM